MTEPTERQALAAVMNTFFPGVAVTPWLLAQVSPAPPPAETPPAPTTPVVQNGARREAEAPDVAKFQRYMAQNFPASR